MRAAADQETAIATMRLRSGAATTAKATARVPRAAVAAPRAAPSPKSPAGTAARPPWPWVSASRWPAAPPRWPAAAAVGQQLILPADSGGTPFDTPGTPRKHRPALTRQRLSNQSTGSSKPPPLRRPTAQSPNARAAAMDGASGWPQLFLSASESARAASGVCLRGRRPGLRRRPGWSRSSAAWRSCSWPATPTARA